MEKNSDCGRPGGLQDRTSDSRRVGPKNERHARRRAVVEVIFLLSIFRIANQKGKMGHEVQKYICRQCIDLRIFPPFDPLDKISASRGGIGCRRASHKPSFHPAHDHGDGTTPRLLS